MIRMGPFVPEDLNVTILFHFGPDEGHQCDRAEFDWYINDEFEAFLNFNNGSTGLNVEQGPFDMDLSKKLNSDLCNPFNFSFVCKSGDGTSCHEGAVFDFTWSTGAKKSFYISTHDPTYFTVCELSAALSDAP